LISGFIGIPFAGMSLRAGGSTVSGGDRPR
jgi:hypothetical protein